MRLDFWNFSSFYLDRRTFLKQSYTLCHSPEDGVTCRPSEPVWPSSPLTHWHLSAPLLQCSRSAPGGFTEPKPLSAHRRQKLRSHSEIQPMKRQASRRAPPDNRLKIKHADDCDGTEPPGWIRWVFCQLGQSLRTFLNKTSFYTDGSIIKYQLEKKILFDVWPRRMLQLVTAEKQAVWLIHRLSVNISAFVWHKT